LLLKPVIDLIKVSVYYWLNHESINLSYTSFSVETNMVHLSCNNEINRKD
jgi:hypothetical protein